MVDLDIVNPMFRSTFFSDALEKAGVDLIASESARIAEGLPTVSEAVRSVFYDDHEWVVFDVGGDEIGVVALGQYHRYFNDPSLDKQFIFVVNTRRPASGAVTRIVELYESVRRVGRIEIDGLLNNTNLALESTAGHLMEGDAILRQVSEEIGKPISYIAGKPDVLKDLEERFAGQFLGEPLEIHPKPRLPWA